MDSYLNSNNIPNWHDYIFYYNRLKQKKKNEDTDVWKQDLLVNKTISKPIHLTCLFLIIMAINFKVCQ